MNWNEAVEEAKQELGIHGWTDNWDEVIKVAKEKYWRGEDFKHTKEDTLMFADYKCLLCDSSDKLTAHHIFYKSDDTICLCKKCHHLVHHGAVSHWGFVLQLVLEYVVTKNDIKSTEFAEIVPSNLQLNAMNVQNKLIEEIEKEGRKCTLNKI